MVGAGAVVTRSVPPNAIVHGNPARIQGYASEMPNTIDTENRGKQQAATVDASHVEGVVIHKLPSFEDIRGRLVAAEMADALPFKPARFFLVHAVPSSEVRGEHAHRECHQFLVCVKGSVHVVVDDGMRRQEFVLDRPEIGIHMKPLVWGTQYKYSADAVLLVFASHPYDPNDYIRDYNKWLEALKPRFTTNT
jgi:dTDP-4-dehydrorhamnose 3,5-epimerase-like enzyme